MLCAFSAAVHALFVPAIDGHFAPAFTRQHCPILMTGKSIISVACGYIPCQCTNLPSVLFNFTAAAVQSRRRRCSALPHRGVQLRRHMQANEPNEIIPLSDFEDMSKYIAVGSNRQNGDDPRVKQYNAAVRSLFDILILTETSDNDIRIIISLYEH